MAQRYPTTHTKIQQLKVCLGELAPFPSHSRVHLLKTLSMAQRQCYVKRDDELGFGISGSKLRKYLSLVPYLQRHHIEEAFLIGGAHSNNILGLSQLLIEHQVRPTLFLKGKKPIKPMGNFLLTSLIVPEENMQWILDHRWPEVEMIASLYAEKKNHKVCIIPEGASMPEALPGALTLALDIWQNEQDIQKEFDHIFLDAGTGLMAIATILAFAWLGKSTIFHIVLMAEDEAAFFKRLNVFKPYFETLVNTKVNLDTIKSRLRSYRPAIAPSFGATNKQVFWEIRKLATHEGFLTDPIYSVKLFMTAQYVLNQSDLQGNCLIVHSGGALTLLGFQEPLANTL